MVTMSNALFTACHPLVTLDVMNTLTNAEKLNAQVAKILSKRRAEVGYSFRRIDEISGVNYMTVKRVLDGSREMKLDDFEAISKALGLVPWQVVKQAEDQLRATPPVVSLDECRSQADAYINETQAKLARVLSRTDLTPAAKPHQPDPYDHAGEESQTPVIEDTH